MNETVLTRNEKVFIKAFEHLGTEGKLQTEVRLVPYPRHIVATLLFRGAADHWWREVVPSTDLNNKTQHEAMSHAFAVYRMGHQHMVQAVFGAADFHEAMRVAFEAQEMDPA